MNDRLRAKPPTTDVDRWREGVVETVDRDEHERRYVVRVVPSGDDRPVEVTVTEALYDLFVGRLEAEDPEGETVWFR